MDNKIYLAIKKYHGQICTDRQHADAFLKEKRTRFFVYLLHANNLPIVLGEGSNKKLDTGRVGAGGRKDVLFPGSAAPSHQKALTAAFASLVFSDCVRVIFPTKSKKHSKHLEEVFKRYFKFGKNYHGKGVYELNMELYHLRLKQLGWEEDKRLTSLLKVLLNAQGCEMGNFKKELLPEWTELFYPELTNKVKMLFGGYYSDL